jgi:type IV pilus assembly protein PilM
VFLFGNKKPAMLGIDISSTCVKLLEISKNKDSYKIESYAVEPLPPNAVAEKNIQDVEAVGEAVKRAVKRSGTRNKLVCLAVPGSAAITKKITMPSDLSEDELEMQIQLEADQYIPYPLEEVNLDFQVLGVSEKTPETIDVLLAASRSENVGARTAVAELAGLTAKEVGIEAYTIEDSFKLMSHQVPDYGVDKTVAVIDVGATMTSLNVLHDGVLTYTREQPFGGKQLTEEIMRRYGLSYEDAGRVKKEGGLPENYEPEVLVPFKETMSQQVGRFLQFYYSATEQENVDHIIMAGGCSAIPGIADIVEHNLGIPTSIANPFANVDLANRVPKNRLLNDSASLLIACGLAMRSVEQ